jgi:hypothetical protein
VVKWAATFLKIIGSPGCPMNEAWVREVAGQSYDRGFDPVGVARQRLAVGASGDRTAALTDAELLVLPGMGHDLPREIWSTLVAAISRLAHRAESLR